MEAQQKTNAVIGQYYLRGIMETASGFKLNADSTFEFFFSYGALDREGKGTWQQTGTQVVFLSTHTKVKNFSLMNSTVLEGNKLTIKITDANPSLRSHVYALVKSGDKKLEEITDSKGEMSFPKTEVDSIQLILEFCPEKIFVFSNANKEHNHFEFRFEKDIMEVFFDNLELTLTEDGMEGRHPLLKEGIYQFHRN
ncbi:hypothetical protein BH11BAC4_BH11BAC4_12320 [soil metagenome]